MTSQNKKTLGLHITKDAHDLDGENDKTIMTCIREALTRGQFGRPTVTYMSILPKPSSEISNGRPT